VKERMTEEGVKPGSELGQNRNPLNDKANYIFHLYAKTTFRLVFNLFTFSMHRKHVYGGFFSFCKIRMKIVVGISLILF
jgi:hypothetical protein